MQNRIDHIGYEPITITFDQLVKQDEEGKVQHAYFRSPNIDLTNPEAYYVQGPRKYVLGKFQTERHHEIIFEAVPALNEVGYMEFDQPA